MKPHLQCETMVCRGAQICAAGAAGLALLAWLSWGFDRWRLTTFGADYVPMAPSTALLFILLSGALFVRSRWPSQPAGRAFGSFSVVAVALLSALAGGQHAFDYEWPVERWLAPTADAVDGIPVGRMSPLTVLTFLLAAVAHLFQLPPFDRHRLFRRAGAGPALAVLLIGLLIILGYASGTPLLYGGHTIPMAMLTAVSFALLGLGLLLAGEAATWMLDLLAGDSPQATGKPSARFQWSLSVLFLFLIASIATAGFFTLKGQFAESRRTQEITLAAIAKLKVAQIVKWRESYLADAKIVLESSIIADHIQQLLANPADARAKRLVLNWMAAWQKHNRYARILLLDTHQQVRFAVPAGKEWSDPIAKSFVATALRTNQIMVSDLHLSPVVQGYAHMDLFVPLLPASGEAVAARVPVGVLLCEIDPSDFLFPLIQSWPTPSRTAETLLARREGDEAVFLNELRHQKSTSLQLRRPISQSRLPAALGARGEMGVREGVDYRGVPVVAAVLAVPDSPWFIVAKVDQVEIYAPLRRRALVVGFLVGALLLAAMLGVALLWRQRSLEFLRLTLAQEQERQALAGRIAYLTKHANDIILLADQHWHILEANDRALETYGYALAELRRMTVRDLYPPEARAEFDRQARQLEATSGGVFETVHQRKDGSTFPVENSARAIELKGVTYYQSILRDVTERKRAEGDMRELLEETERARAALSSILEDQQQAEATLRASEQRFRELAEHIREVFWMTDPSKNRMLYVSPGYETIWGRTLESLYQSPLTWVDAIHPEDRERVLTAALTKQALGEYDEEYRIMRPDGAMRWIRDRAFPVRDEIGEVRRIAGIAEDITERKQAEAARQALYRASLQIQEPLGLQERLTRLLETAQMVLALDRVNILLTDAEGQWLEAVASAGTKDALATIRVPIGPAGGGLAQAYRSQKIVAWDGRGPVPEPLRLQPPYDQIPAIRSRAFAVLPLVVQGRAIGVMGADRKYSSQPLEPTTLELLQLFASQAALAIAQAQLFEEVRSGRERLRNLSRRLVEIQEVERRQIARELHDQIGQVLTGLKLYLEMGFRSCRSDEARSSLADAQALLNDLMARVRDLALDLRPAILDHLGLLPALLWHARRYTEQTRVDVNLQHAGLERRFPPDLETAAYRIVQESLTNVARHAGVPEVTVRAWADSATLHLQIEDKGNGFDSEAVVAAGTSSGLVGMRERTVLLGGHLTIESDPGKGTRLTVELPLGESIERRIRERET